MPIFQLMKESFCDNGTLGKWKSTLLRCINRLIRPTAGQVLVNGVDISKISEKSYCKFAGKSWRWFSRISVCYLTVPY